MGIYNVPKPIQEVYFGKTIGIYELQKRFSKFRELFINDVFVFSTKINISKELMDFNRTVEGEFGFKSFSLYVINDIYHQAYTVPVGLTPGKSMTSSKSGFKLNKKNGYTTLVCISTGLLLDKSFSDEEILAILLHEIGHNFSQNIDSHTSIFYVISTIASVVHIIETILLVILAPMKILDEVGKMTLSIPLLNTIFISFGNHFKKKNKNATKTFDFLIGALNGIQAVLNEQNKAIHIFKILLSKTTSLDLLYNYIFNFITKATPMEILSSYLGYNGEKVSDNFATVYGYGAELSSALMKMEMSSNGSISNKALEYVPLISNMYKLMTLPVEILATGFDCHPNTVSRVSQQIDFLEVELAKTDLDLKVKDCMLKDIQQLNKVLDDNLFSRTQNKLKDTFKDPYLLSRVYSATVYRLCGGDIRNVLSTMDNNVQYDDAYEKYNKKE